jgi:hypothetical protein
MDKNLVSLLRNEPYKIGQLCGFKDLTELHNEWLKMMIYGDDEFTLLAHRGSYKTTCLSICFAFIIVLFPYKTIIFVRKTDDDVIEVIKQVSNLLKTSIFQTIALRLYGCEIKFTQDTSFKLDTSLNTSTKGMVQLLGIGSSGSLTGKHADIVVTDDIVNLKDRISRAERERVKNVYMELQNVKNRGGRIFNTGTPWHKEDCIATKMPNKITYDCYSTGLIDREKLEQIRQSMTPSLFSANYELKHIADADALFTNPKFTSDETLIYDGVSHIDASYGGEDGTAYTICKFVGGKFYMLGKRWNKHVDDCLSEIYALQDKYRVGSISCERNADKGYLAKELRNNGQYVEDYSENMNKFIKISTYLRKYWNDIIWLEETDADYINEILDYTENAQHDDAPDSASCMIRKFKGKREWLF